MTKWRKFGYHYLDSRLGISNFVRRSHVPSKLFNASPVVPRLFSIVGRRFHYVHIFPDASGMNNINYFRHPFSPTKKGKKESPRASNINWRHPLHRNSSGDLAKWEREKSVRCQGGLLFATCLERRQNVRVVFNLSTWHSLPKITSSSIIEIDPPSGADVFKNSCCCWLENWSEKIEEPFRKFYWVAKSCDSWHLKRQLILFRGIDNRQN